MTSEWRQVTFAQLVEARVLEIGDGYRAKNSELGGDGPIFLRAGHVRDTHIDLDGAERFHNGLTGAVASKMSRPGDVIVTTKGNSTGRTGFIDGRLPFVVYSPHLSYWRSLDARVLVPGFLRYWARSQQFRDQLSGLASSTDMAPYLSLIDQKRLRVTLPPLVEQRRIADILGAFDDKIEVNRRMNDTLEAMGRALFKSWFVDFDPVRAKAEGRDPGLPKSVADLFPDRFEDSELGEIPRGWCPSAVADLADVNARTLGRMDRLDVIDYIEISEVMRGQVASIVRYARGAAPDRARRRLVHGDTVLSTVRPDRGAHFLCLKPPETLIASTGFAVVSPRDGNWAFLYSALTRSEVGGQLGRLADGGAYPAVRHEAVAGIRLVIPSGSEIRAAFEMATRPLYERAEQNRIENRSLGALRDTLLPKLVSGEIHIPEAERMLEAAPA